MAAIATFSSGGSKRSLTSPCLSFPPNLKRSAKPKQAPLRCPGFCARQGSVIKKNLMASEQERADVKEARRAWIARLPRMRLEPHRLVFIDETSTNTKMCRLYGRSLGGKRLKASAPFGRWGTQTFIAGLRCYGLTAPWVIDGPMNRAFFRRLHRDPACSYPSEGRRRHPRQSRRP